MKFDFVAIAGFSLLICSVVIMLFILCFSFPFGFYVFVDFTRAALEN